MDDLEVDIQLKQRKLEIIMEDFPADQLDQAELVFFDKNMSSFESAYNEFVLSVESLCIKHKEDLGNEGVNRWKHVQTEARAKAVDYRKKMRKKAFEIGNAACGGEVLEANVVDPNLLDLKKKELLIQERVLAAKEKKSAEKAAEALKEASLKRSIAVAKAKHKASAITDECEALNEKISIEHISDLSNLEITRLMKEKEKWKEDLEKIKILKRSLEDISDSSELTDGESELAAINVLVDAIVKEVKEVCEAVEEEDSERELYSLDESKNDKVKLPFFEGRDDEDFSKWKELVERAFIKNRVAKDDKLTKLREVLKGHAKKLVPFSMTSTIDDAWKALESAFGDPNKLMQNRKDALQKLGSLPKDNAKGGLKAKVEWFLELEVVLKSIKELGSKSNDMYAEAFSPSTFMVITRLFPSKEVLKLKKIPGDCDEEKMEKFIEKIAEFRSDAQTLQLVMDAGSSFRPCQSGGQSSSGGSKGKSADSHSLSLVAYKPPRRDETCRVCNQLETQGDTTDLYDNHLHNYITGCPRYISMTIEERNDVCYKAKVCRFCHDPDYVFQKAGRGHDCPVRNKKKSRYTCTDNRCFVHAWICVDHKDKNRKKLDDFKSEISKKYNLQFGFIAKPPQVFSPPKKVVKLTTALKAKKSESVSRDKAQITLRKKLKSVGIDEELLPVPEGRPVFMLGYTKGKTRPLLTLYDTGCGSVLFREGVPQQELCPSKLRQKGPFLVNGVGDTDVKVNSEWMCSVSLLDSTRQTLEGWTVDKITATLPMISMTAAEAELKQDGNENQELQSLCSPPRVGGDVDILLGELYKRIFPTPIHSLSSGLTIYKLKIRSHDEKYSCVIGGPHKSFSIANYFGGMSSFFAHLSEQLSNYKDFGPPKLPPVIMTCEDIAFAKAHKDWEIDNHTDIFDEYSLFDGLQANDDAESNESETEGVALMCSSCGVSSSDCLYAVKEISEEESSIAWKRAAQYEGISIEYRCPKCRSCNDCRRSFATERVSIREEAEDQMIYDSVHLDWENKRIICSLPMRGTEQEFLSNNREIALKILNQQCSKYFEDQETKEVILKAFKKLMDNDQLVLYKDLTEEEKAIIESKNIQHYIPWRVVFKDSLSTPCRPVMDGSSNTKMNSDGNGGGRSLNDLVVKGRVVTLNLVRMMLRFMVGRAACQGDLRQFYASIKLVTEHWNLQRVLFRNEMDPDGEIMEGIIKTLIWGIKCVSAQSECSIIKIAEAVKDEHPDLSIFLLSCRFVDDIASSASKIEILKDLTKKADNIFNSLGLSCKGWSFSGSDPPEQVAEENNTVKLAGMVWYPKLDLLEIPLPQLHFSNRSRGRLVAGSKVYDGSMKMEEFVPKSLTRRMIVSKNSSIFDLPGKLVPVLIGLKADVSEAIEETKDWDDEVSPELRSKWVKNFLMIESLRGIKFNRATMPPEAISEKMNIITGGDFAKAKIVGCWGRFRLKSGMFSCQLIIGRSLVGSNQTIPKGELDVLMMACNLSWIVRQALDDWIDEHTEIGDSSIALCWSISKEKRLSIFHRNRVAQINRSTGLENLYHCISEENPCDVGTRPDLVKLDDVGPLSKWEKGLPWMNGEIEDAVKNEILTPALSLKIDKIAEEQSFKEGLIFEKSKEILTKGHPTVLFSQDLVRARFEYSDYLLSPTKFKFEKCVRIYSIIMKFIRSFKCVKDKISTCKDDQLHMFFSRQSLAVITPIVSYKEGENIQRIHLYDEAYVEAVCNVSDYSPPVSIFDYPADTLRVSNLSFGCENPGKTFKGKYHIMLANEDVAKALEYLFRKGSLEVKKFQKAEFVKKIAVESNQILYSKTRILDTMRFQITGGLEEESLGLGEFGIKSKTPVLDRFSPLAYSVGEYIHRKISRHGGYEKSYRESLNHVFIIQGLSLFREIGTDCVRCDRLRKRYLDVSMGPVGDEQLMIAPPFYVTMCDIFGPCKIFVPGHSMATRGRKVIDVKAYILVFLCPTTKCVNLQVIEGKSADAVAEGVTRLGCEVGMPSLVLVDQDSAIMKVLREAEVDLKNIDLLLFKEKGIRFRTCPVSGHNMHGACERKIKSIQECMEESDFSNMRLHACGLQTLLKLIENDINSLPLGYSYGRDADNSPLLKLIFPNMLRVGRNNRRALDGPVRMPSSPGELMQKVQKGYSMFYKVFNEAMVPKLLKMQKWYKSDAPLMVDDIIYFRKEENELSSKWLIGKIISVEKGRDGLIRRCTIQYRNADEDFSRTTDRAVRSIVKLMHIDDVSWMDEIAVVEKIIKATNEDVSQGKSYVVNKVDDEGLKFKFTATSRDRSLSPVQVNLAVKGGNAKSKKSDFLKPCRRCCCIAHCVFFQHNKDEEMVMIRNHIGQENKFFDLFDRSWQSHDALEDDVEEIIATRDPFMSLLCATNLNLGDVSFTAL